MTKTLLKVSEIARTDFELLDEREERAALEDLEHLLLTDFPEAELPAPTRVSFAATRIARLASGRVGSVANLTALERQLVATTDHRLKHQLKNTIKTVRGKHRNDAIREGARVFNLLIEAVREYPEKLRLWVRALEFCRAVGHSNLDELVTYLLAQCKENETGSRVIRARILQTFAHQIVRCGQVIVALDEAPARREAAENYIRALPRYIARIKSSIKTPQPYEQMSIDLCSGACGIARVLLGGRFARSLAPANPIEWSSLPDGWPKGVWAWWSEMIIGTGATMQPGSIWRIVTPQLAANDAVSQAVLRRYPKLEGVPTISKNSLAEWSDWTSQRWRADAFDPRAGEWTAVCIALRLVEIAESRKTRVNAGSVFVPTEWAKSSETPSWHQWKSDFDAASKLDSLPSESGSGLSAIQNIAIILLGLLRRNLRWPADWNAPGPQYTSERVLRTMIGEARASSWTTAILEACLLPECRETIALFFSAPVVPMESDIARRALFIRRLKTLRKYLERAREVLANSQMTVHEDQPRQLIPIHIEQISREEWGIEEGNDFDPEVDDD